MTLRDELRSLLARHEGNTAEAALRDATTELIHLADERGVVFGDVYDGACEAFLEEIGAG